MVSVGLAGSFVAGWLLLACAQQAEAPEAGSIAVPVKPNWPELAVLAVDDRAITSGEVDLASSWIARVELRRSDSHLRRLAVCQINIPRAVAAVRFSGERERALAAAQARLQALREAKLAGPPLQDGALCERVEGGWSELGFVVWGSLLDLPRGEWSEILEEPGRFVVARTLSQTEGNVPAAAKLVIDACVFPFAPAELTTPNLDQLFEEHTLTIIDPAWATIVPELLQYRMRGKDG